MNIKTLALFLGLTVFVWATSIADEYIYTDCWGKAGYTLESQSKSKVTINYSVDKFGLLDLEIDGEPMLNIDLPGSLLFNNEGAPNLPGSGRYLAIPKGATAKFTIISFRKETINNVNIAPAPRIPWETETDPMEYLKDMGIYSKNAFYPENPVQLSEPTIIRGIDVVMLGITPFQYNAVTKELIVYRDLKIEVTFKGGTGHVGEDRLRSRWFDPLLEDMLLNASSLPKINYNRSFQEKDDIGCEYLIISPNGTEFQQWADTIRNFRTMQGIQTMVVTLSDIGGNNANTIENYINDAYANWDIVPSAILLLGDYGIDADNSVIAPIYDNYCVSDNIYSDINGNHMPDIVTARITASNAAQLETMVSKFINYELNPPTNPDFYNHPMTCLGYQTERWFQICTESVAGYWENELGKTTTRVNAIYNGDPQTGPWSTAPNTSTVVNYFGQDGLGYIPQAPGDVNSTWNGSGNSVVQGINNGSFMLLHRDHGSETLWGEPDFDNSDVNNLNNIDLTYIWSVNCLTGKYNYTGGECLVEKLHRHSSAGNNAGALGAIGDSEVSYSFVNDTYVWGAFDNMWPDFMPAYGSTPEERGIMPSFANAAGKYFLEQSNWPYNTINKEVTYYLFHHHGDGFLSVYSELPQDLTVNHNPILYEGVTNFDVSANAGALIALTVNGEIIGTADATGVPVSIVIPGQVSPDQVIVTITKQNYYRYSAVVDVIPPTGPYVVRESYTINDDTGNGNGMMDYGETNLLSLTVKNIGVQQAENIDVTVSSIDPYITITDDSESYGNIAIGETVSITDGFAYYVANNIPDGRIVSFEVTATDGTGTWISYFSIEGHAPVLEFIDFAINDPNGNGNGKIDPGETVDITIEIKNNGSSKAYNIEGELTVIDPFLTINSGLESFGDLTAGNTTSTMFNCTAAANTPLGHLVNIEFNMSADLGITGTGSFNTVVGQIPVLIVDLDGNSNSEDAMEEALADMDIAFEVLSSFPPDLNIYSSIFVCLGIYSDNHILSAGEGTSLADYLDNGGYLYMEGGDTWYYDSPTAVHSMFNINGISDGSSDLGSIAGQSGTFTDGMTFSYTGDNGYIDRLEPIAPAFTIFKNQSPLYATAVAYDEGSYKTIGSSHEFSGLVDGSSPSTKTELMMEYMGFFGITASFQASFTSNFTEVCEQGVVAFTDLSSGSATSWFWTFEGASPATSTLQNPQAAYFTAGTYDVNLEVSDGVETASITITDYISVITSPGQASTPEGDNEVCTNTILTSDYLTTGASMADSYVWEILPSDAGSVTGTGMTATVEWAMNWSGTATLKVKGINDCGEGGFSQGFSILCSVCTGIDENTLREGVEVYPNPSLGIFNVKFNADLGETHIRVFNMLNEVVVVRTMDSQSGDILPIDISELSQGIYFMSIQAGGSELIKKLIVR